MIIGKALNVKYLLITMIIVMVVMFYFTIATAVLGDSMCHGGQYSLFSENQYCRTPSLFAAAFCASLGISVGLTTVIIYRRFLKR
jgi:hypothetical protein